MAEKQYIERDCIVDSIRESFDFYYQIPIYPSDREVQNIVNRVKRIVQELPAADVAPVVHGEWMQNPYCKRIFYCSECGGQVEDGSCNPNPSKHFPYCHCGAKMDGGKDETD